MEITAYEVKVAAHNAALIANSGCPSRYRATKWESVFWHHFKKARDEMFDR